MEANLQEHQDTANGASCPEPRTPTASPRVDTFLRSLESPSAISQSPRRSIVYSDRFIPSRATSSRLGFSLLDREMAASENPGTADRDDANPAYRNMLRAALLGNGYAMVLGAPAMRSALLACSCAC